MKKSLHANYPVLFLSLVILLIGVLTPALAQDSEEATEAQTSVQDAINAQIQEVYKQDSLFKLRQELADVQGEIEALRGDLLRALETQRGTRKKREREATQIREMMLRLDDLDVSLRAVTGNFETMRFDIEQVLARIGNQMEDFEFRVIELEGGDTSQLTRKAETAAEEILVTADALADPDPSADTLATPTLAPEDSDVPGYERAGYNRAIKTFQNKEMETAEAQFALFLRNYPSSALSGEAFYWLAEAQARQRKWSLATSNYLNALQSNTPSRFGANALLGYGLGLYREDKFENSCRMLSLMAHRYPQDEFMIEQAEAKTLEIGCP